MAHLRIQIIRCFGNFKVVVWRIESGTQGRRIGARTEKFQSVFYPHCLSEWNELDLEVRTEPSFAVFKLKLLSKIRSSTKTVFSFHEPKGLSMVHRIAILSAIAHPISLN